MTEKIDPDLQWLLNQAPEKDLLQTEARLVKPLVDDLLRYNKPQPYTVGLFGTWGCGKTTILSLAAKQLVDSHKKVVYFNAWKYAGTMEIVPAMVYKILTSISLGKEDKKATAAEIAATFGRVLSKTFSPMLKPIIGINLHDATVDTIGAFKELQSKSAVPAELLEEYFTSVDKAQASIGAAFEDFEEGPIFVFVDELDRCDPDEAFEVVKQLRVFFGMNDVPLRFVLSVNPEPIGLAIQHKYGLSSGTSEFESSRILEKFVDTYFNATKECPLGEFVLNAWNKEGLEMGTSGLIAWIEIGQYFDNGRKVSAKRKTLIDVFTTLNPVFENLRIIEKASRNVALQQDSVTRKYDSRQTFIFWILEILKQSQPNLRKEIGLMSNQISMSAAESYHKLFSSFHECDGSMTMSEVVEYYQENHGEKPGHFNTYYDFFRTYFRHNFEIMLNTKNRSPEDEKFIEIMGKNESDTNSMDIIILCSLINFNKKAGGFPVFGSQVMYDDDYKKVWKDNPDIRALAKLLATY